MKTTRDLGAFFQIQFWNRRFDFLDGAHIRRIHTPSKETNAHLGSQACHVCTVDLVAMGNKFAFEIEAEVGLGLKESLDDLLVFFGLDAARAVKNGSAGFEAARGLIEEFLLGGREAGNFCFLQAPAEVDAAAQDTGIRARRVDQDAIEKAVRCRGTEFDFSTEAFGVFFHQREALGLDVFGDDGGLIGGELGDISGLAARRGTKIENAFAGAGAQFFGRQQSAWILQIEKPLLEACERLQRRMPDQFKNQRRPIELFSPEFDALGLPHCGQFVKSPAQCVHACEDRRRLMTFIDEGVAQGARVPAICKQFGLSTKTLMRWRKAGKGPAYFRTPGFVLYPLAVVEQYEQANTIIPEGS